MGDTSVIRGVLPNGLTYYVRRNAEPRARAELRLVVNAGSVLEDQDQRGLAHFLEHMAFNGTRRFEKHEIVDYLERVGMRFGPDINAYTSFDETVYMLQLPTDSAGVLDTGLQILRDWADGITMDPEEIEKERGVVIEEWRRSRGAGRAHQRPPVPLPVRRVALRRAPAHRRPGDAADVPAGDAAPLLRAVVPAGADGHRRGGRVRPARDGGAHPPRSSAGCRRSDGPARPEIAMPFPDSTRYMVTVDPEVPRTTVSINWMMPAKPDTTPAEIRRGIVDGMFAGLLGDRLQDISLQPDAPFMDVGSYQGGSLRPVETFVLNAAVAEGGAERGLGALVAELERAARHGFTAAELEREKTELLRMWEQIHAERAKTT